MPLQCGIFEGFRSISMLLDVPMLKRNKFRDPRFRITKRVTSEKGPTHEPCRDIGRALLLCRLGMKAVRQHSPTRKRFMVTKPVIFFEWRPPTIR